MEPNALIDFGRSELGAMLDTLMALVRQESPSRDKSALDSLGTTIAGRFEAIGGTVERTPNAEGGDHLRIRFEGRDPSARPILVIGHFDTVWPVGTLQTMPARVDLEADRAYGPGIFDMKASFVLTEWALRALQACRRKPGRPLVLLFTSDEEIGSTTSRQIIENEARRGECALVLESPLAGGRLKTARKGVGRFDVEVIGRAAHAGIEPEKGVSAIEELAHQILAIHALTDFEKGTTLNVGVIRGGTTTNTVAERAGAAVDLRVGTPEEAARVEAAMRALRPHHPEAKLSVTGGLNRPPMVRTEPIGALFERAREIARPLGIELTEGATGGGSDGNFTAAAGLPTLDGLGVLGAGAHAATEQIVISSLPERAALLAALLDQL